MIMDIHAGHAARRAVVMLPGSTPKSIDPRETVVFLAGSIDEGRAEKWQDEAIASLSDLDVVVLNPRRDHWNAGLRQDIDEPEFVDQVDWELDGIERADVVLFHFSPAGPAPITLLELGKATALRKRIVISCPEGYWRRGNVQVVARRAGTQVHDSLAEAMTSLRKMLRSYGHEAVTMDVDEALRRALMASTVHVYDPIMLDDVQDSGVDASDAGEPR